MSDAAETGSENLTQPTDPVTPAVATDSAAPTAATPTNDTPPATNESAPADVAASTPPATDAPAAIPESYALKADGFQFNEVATAALAPAFKEAGLTQAQVDVLAKAYAGLVRDTPAQMLARDLEVVAKDPELGGANWGRTQGYVRTAMSAFGDPEFGKFVNEAGIGNRPEFVRVFERIGRLMTGDVPVRGGQGGAPELSRAEKIYGRSSNG